MNRLGHYVKRTDTGRRGYYWHWWAPRGDGMALVWWADDGLPSLISVKYLTDWFAA